MARCRKILERKHIGKIEAIPAAVSLDFSNAFAPKSLRQMAVANFGFRAEPPAKKTRHIFAPYLASTP
jgi:hypothetical protein